MHGKNGNGRTCKQVSNRPDSIFEGKAVTLEGRDNGRCCFITCGRGMGRNGKVSHGDFQLNYCANNKINTRHNTTTNLSFGGASMMTVAAIGGKMMSQLMAQISINSQR